MKILIATDGSKFSNAAIETVCRLIGDGENAQVKIVSAYQQPLTAAVAAAPYAVPLDYNPALEEQLRKSADETVAQAEKTIGERCPALLTNLTTVVLCGPPEQAIIEEAEKWGADLIVTGSHGYGFWSRAFLGSVSNSVAHHAPCSVLIARATHPADA